MYESQGPVKEQVLQGQQQAQIAPALSGDEMTQKTRAVQVNAKMPRVAGDEDLDEGFECCY